MGHATFDRAVTLHRRVRFAAWHHYALPELSPEANRARFGAQAEPHEHAFTVDVAVRGRPDPRTGFVVDLGMLDGLLRERVVEPLSGRSLNEADPAFAAARPLPSTEALATWIFDRLAPRLPSGVALEAVRVAEDDSLGSEVRAGERG